MADSNHTVQIEVDAASGLDQTNMDSYLRFNIPASTYANKKVWKHEILVVPPGGEEWPAIRAINLGKVPATMVVSAHPDNETMIWVGWKDHTLPLVGYDMNFMYLAPGEQAIIPNIGINDTFGLSEDATCVMGTDDKLSVCRAEILVFEV